MSNHPLIPQAYRDLWADPALQSRIDEGIRRHRQGEAQIQITDSRGAPLSGVKIQAVQQDSPFHFGANIFMLGGYATGELNRKYEEAFCGLFNGATVPFYWPGTEPEQGHLRFSEGSTPMARRPPPDAVVAFCQKNGLRMHGHTLVWESTEWSIPNWLSPDPAISEPLWEKRVREIAERYGKVIKRWDVINEPVSDYYRYVPTHPMPDNYPRKAFAWAEKYFPSDVRQDINETPGAWAQEFEPYFRLIQNLRADGSRIGAVGLQFHVHTDAELGRVLSGELYRPSQLLETLDRYAELELPIHISEITLTSPDNSDDGQEAQAEVARNFYRLWFSHRFTEGITWWNLPDGGAAPGQNEVNPGLVTKDMTPKRSYHVLHDLLHKEWRTSISGTTDEQGRFLFRGFHGRYRVTTGSGLEGNLVIEPGKPAAAVLQKNS